MVICGSLTFGRLFDFISAHDQLSGALYFSFLTDLPFIFDEFVFLIFFLILNV